MRTFVLSLLLLSACGSRPERGGTEEGSPDNPGGGPGMGGGTYIPDQPQSCAKMDIVFVVDNSGSMSEEQGNLAANFPRFIDVLNGFRSGGGKPLDYRVALTTTGRDVSYKIVLGPLELPFNEKGQNGEFLFKKECGMTRNWIGRDDPGSVSKIFSCAADVGTGGPSIEMPLYAMNLAFVDRVKDGKNVGFLRDDALLGLVVLTDEDDCSREDNNFNILTDQCEGSKEVQPVSKYIDMLDKTKQARGRWAAAVIAGPNSCTSRFGSAGEAKRLKQFVSETGKNAVFSSICAGDLTQALQEALMTFNAACESFPPLG